MNATVVRAPALSGRVLLPADKSIAHRAALFAAIADGTTAIRNFPDAADPRSTLACLKQLGVRIHERSPGEITIEGCGRTGLQTPGDDIDCGNSGTTLRLLAGILAGRGIPATLTGDASLSRRPMERIAIPLRHMGARVALTDRHAPMHILSAAPLQGIRYELPVPSAQVKSCVLLAGLFASGQTTVIETVQSRDHTERMLRLPVEVVDGRRHIIADTRHPVMPFDITLPGDFSAASFFLVGGSIVPGTGPLQLPGVGLNPTRSALLSVLRKMGADVRVMNRSICGGEPVGNLEVYPAALQAVTIGGDIIANLIDEIPVLAIAAACASGRTLVTGARELRVKECDRIRAIVTGLRALGADITEFDDGFAVEGGRALTGTRVDSFGDHRIAMAMGIAGLVARGKTTITGAEAAEVSFPRFWEVLKAITA